MPASKSEFVKRLESDTRSKVVLSGNIKTSTDLHVGSPYVLRRHPAGCEDQMLSAVFMGTRDNQHVFWDAVGLEAVRIGVESLSGYSERENVEYSLDPVCVGSFAEFAVCRTDSSLTVHVNPRVTHYVYSYAIDVEKIAQQLYRKCVDPKSSPALQLVGDLIRVDPDSNPFQTTPSPDAHLLEVYATVKSWIAHYSALDIDVLDQIRSPEDDKHMSMEAYRLDCKMADLFGADTFRTAMRAYQDRSNG